MAAVLQLIMKNNYGFLLMMGFRVANMVKHIYRYFPRNISIFISAVCGKLLDNFCCYAYTHRLGCNKTIDTEAVWKVKAHFCAVNRIGLKSYSFHIFPLPDKNGHLLSD